MNYKAGQKTGSVERARAWATSAAVLIGFSLAGFEGRAQELPSRTIEVKGQAAAEVVKALRGELEGEIRCGTYIPHVSKFVVTCQVAKARKNSLPELLELPELPEFADALEDTIDLASGTCDVQGALRLQLSLGGSARIGHNELVGHESERATCDTFVQVKCETTAGAAGSTGKRCELRDLHAGPGEGCDPAAWLPSSGVGCLQSSESP